MTAPIPDDDDNGGPAPSYSLSTPEDASRGRFLLARKWAYVISTTAYLPLTHAELEQHMLHLVNRLFATIRTEPFDPGAAAGIGSRLVELKCVGPDSIRRTVEVLGKALLHQPELRATKQLAERVVLVLGSMMAGYSETLRSVTQQRQEDLSRSLLQASEEARRTKLIGQAWFGEVFRSSSSGIALAGLDGRLHRVNAALAEILRRESAELTGLTLFDLAAPGEEGPLRKAVRQLAFGVKDRLAQQCLFIGGDGMPVRVSLRGSLVRDGDGDGETDHLIVVAEEDSEVAELRRRLTEASRRDPLTGLLNRQAFLASLRAALRRCDPETGITLYHLDIDGFSLVNAGLGQETADRLLVRAAECLRRLVADETASVARLGPDEFGIVVENKANRPDVVAMVDRFREEFNETVYLDGEHGVAASVSIGVVDRPDPDSAPEELLRAAEITVHRARGEGRGQWALFDPDANERERCSASLATSLPGAWEIGEAGLEYRPMVRLDGDRPAGAEVALYWDHPHLGRLEHAECVAFAERTGFIVPLGAEVLATACAYAQRADIELLSVPLTKSQAADPDLIGLIRRVLQETGLGEARLELGFPATALAHEDGEARQNFALLADIGVRTAIHGFGTAGDAVFLEDLPVKAIRLSPAVVADQARRPEPDSLVTRVTLSMLEVVRTAEVEVGVDGVDTPEQAGFWRSAGADFALGALFPPAERS